jgi:hypothetical protein
MRRAMAMWTVVTIMISGYGLKSLQAQEENKSASETNTVKAERPVKPVHAYRVDFSISELEGGKKINTRHYSMDLNSGPWTQIKIGTRVPVSTSQNSFQYLDLGTSIDCEIGEEGDDLSLDVRSDFSNLSSPEEHSTQPIIRQIKINGRTLAVPGKPIAIGSVDDPNSNRQFQLEATVTRLR